MMPPRPFAEPRASCCKRDYTKHATEVTMNAILAINKQIVVNNTKTQKPSSTPGKHSSPQKGKKHRKKGAHKKSILGSAKKKEEFNVRS